MRASDRLLGMRVRIPSSRPEHQNPWYIVGTNSLSNELYLALDQDGIWMVTVRLDKVAFLDGHPDPCDLEDWEWLDHAAR